MAVVAVRHRKSQRPGAHPNGLNSRRESINARHRSSQYHRPRGIRGRGRADAEKIPSGMTLHSMFPGEEGTQGGLCLGGRVGR